MLSRSRLLKRASPSVTAVERIVEGDKPTAPRQVTNANAPSGSGAGAGAGAGVRTVDDYNARAVRHSLRVFLGTAMAMKGWALISTKFLGGKPE